MHDIGMCSKPPNQEHIGNSAVVSFVERMSSLGGSKCSKLQGNQLFETLKSVLCRELYYYVPTSEGQLLLLEVLLCCKCRSLHSSRSLSCCRDLREATCNHESCSGYRCILKVFKQLRHLLECNNRLRQWVISFSFSVQNANIWWGV